MTKTEQLAEKCADKKAIHEAETKTLEKLIEPKFKVWDKIKNKYTNEIGIIHHVLSNGDNVDQYDIAISNEIGKSIDIDTQDDWELVPNKFDITTLKPFDKVLVRHNDSTWRIQFFKKYDTKLPFAFICLGNFKYRQCIPYEENKHLLGTTNDCDEYYKTWE